MMRKLAFAALLLSLGACKQGVGEICQVDSDCASNNCSRMVGTDEMPAVNHCLPADDDTDPVPDANPEPAPDAAPPDAIPLDAGPPDAAV